MGSLKELLGLDALFIYLFIYFSLIFFWNVCLSYLCLFLWNEKKIDILNEKDWFIACFKLFLVFACKGKFISFHSYWHMKGQIFVIFEIVFWFIHDYLHPLLHTENNCDPFFWTYCCFFTFDPLRRIYLGFAAVCPMLFINIVFLKHNQK